MIYMMIALHFSSSEKMTNHTSIYICFYTKQKHENMSKLYQTKNMEILECQYLESRNLRYQPLYIEHKRLVNLNGNLI